MRRGYQEYRSAAAALLLLVAGSRASGQEPRDTGADTVVSFQPGTGQSVGQGPEYFPRNVLGLPDRSSRPDMGIVDPYQILSLGRGGVITLRFDRNVIVDRPGADFTVFENAFNYRLGGKDRVYAEPAEISVSRDGVTFTPFPYDSLTLAGCAGVTPVNGAADPGDPRVSGGDSFDLARLGIDSVRWVRIRDVTAVVADNPEHPFWDPTLTGFDLDAVVVVTADGASSTRDDADLAATSVASVIPNPTASSATVRFALDRPGLVRLHLSDLLGRELHVSAGERMDAGPRAAGLDLSSLPAGLYLLTIESSGRVVATLPLRRME